MDIFGAFTWLNSLINSVIKYSSQILSFFGALLETGISHLNSGNVAIGVLILIVVLKIVHNIK